MDIIKKCYDFEGRLIDFEIEYDVIAIPDMHFPSFEAGLKANIIALESKLQGIGPHVAEVVKCGQVNKSK